MSESELSMLLFEQLQQFDTPTICNALEVLVPERRGSGFTRETLCCIEPDALPVVALARTATIRACEPSPLSAADLMRKRTDYYTYVADGDLPRIVIMQDLDPEPGFGSFWGEVNSHVHRGLGCAGVLTNGSVRDLADLATDFQILAGKIGPSHAYVHVVDFGQQVNIYGMSAQHDDLIHADQHGAVIIPKAVAADIPETVATLVRKEAVILDAARAPDFDIEVLKHALASAAEIH